MATVTASLYGHEPTVMVVCPSLEFLSWKCAARLLTTASDSFDGLENRWPHDGSELFYQIMWPRYSHVTEAQHRALCPVSTKILSVNPVQRNAKLYVRPKLYMSVAYPHTSGRFLGASLRYWDSSLPPQWRSVFPPWVVVGDGGFWLAPMVLPKNESPWVAWSPGQWLGLCCMASFMRIELEAKRADGSPKIPQCHSDIAQYFVMPQLFVASECPLVCTDQSVVVASRTKPRQECIIDGASVVADCKMTSFTVKFSSDGNGRMLAWPLDSNAVWVYYNGKAIVVFATSSCQNWDLARSWSLMASENRVLFSRG